MWMEPEHLKITYRLDEGQTNGGWSLMDLGKCAWLSLLMEILFNDERLNAGATRAQYRNAQNISKEK